MKNRSFRRLSESIFINKNKPERIMRKEILAILALALIANSAFVHGDIVKSQNDDSTKTLIRIEGKFTYQMITNNSNYSIFLPDGEYVLQSQGITNGGQVISSVSNKLSIGADDQRIDLLLKREDNSTYYIVIVAIVLIAAIVIIWKMENKNNSPQTQQKQIIEPQLENEDVIEETAPVENSKKEELDDDAKKVIAIIESNEGRITQKELRETLGFSEAKLSLILSELEYIQIIKKFKRGRGNIVKKI